jgi:hypothetical protein
MSRATTENWPTLLAKIFSCEQIGYKNRGGDPIFRTSIEYKIGKKYYSTVFSSNTQYAQDDTIAIQYDPANPARNDLSASEHKRILLQGIGIAIGVILCLLFFCLRHFI